jgi:hypothetical protein
MIPLREWNYYLRSLYESPNFVENIPNVSIEDESFSIEHIKFGVT